MKPLLTLLASLAATVAVALTIVPFALGDPLSGNKTTVGICPNSKQYTNSGLPILISTLTGSDYDAALLSDVNQDGYVCQNSVSDKSNGAGQGFSYIDNTAHNQNG